MCGDDAGCEGDSAGAAAALCGESGTGVLVESGASFGLAGGVLTVGVLLSMSAGVRTALEVGVRGAGCEL